MSELSLTGSLSISDQLILSASLLDTDGNTGTMGQVFSSTVTGSMWVDADSGAQGTQGTQGTQGEIGTQGTQGIQGETGTTGTQGTQGTQGETGTQGENGTQGTTGTDGTFGGASFDYTFDSGTTAADPGTGEVALSSTTQNTATEMYIDATDDNGSSINTFMTSIDAVTSAVKGHVRVSSKTDANTFLLFAISDLTNNTGWWTIDISIEASSASAPFSNSDDVVVSFVTTGDRGDKGDTGTQGTGGDTGTQGTSGATPFPYIGDAQITGSLLVQGDAQVEGNDAFVYQGKGATTGYQGIKLENSLGNFQAGVATNVGVFFTDSTANSANVGTSVSNNLHLATDDTVRLTIDSSGQTGIGTTSPGGVFDVSYDAAALNAPRLTDTRSFAINNGAGLDFMGKYNTAGNTARFGSIYGKKENATDGSNAGYLEFQTNNIARLTISSSGDATFTGAISTPQVDISGSFSTTGSVEFSYLSGSAGAAAWSTGGALNDGRNFLAGVGQQNASLAFGGNANAASTCTEEYNGTSWSTGGDMATARCSLGGAGIQNAALGFGGVINSAFTNTEEYDGSSWSAGGSMQCARYCMASGGTQNAAFSAGGKNSSFAPVACTEEYDGISWSNGGALQLANAGGAGAGTQNAALSFGGYTGGTDTEEYNGTSWSSGGALSVSRYQLAGAGVQNAALAMGGNNGSDLTCTEEYDGSSWSTKAAMSLARRQLAGAGTTPAALVFGGNVNSTCTEEYTSATTYTPKKTFDYDDTTGDLDISGSSHVTGSFVTTGSVDMAYQSGSATFTPGGSWSTGGALATARYSMGGAGTQNATLAFGGDTTSEVACTEEYNGSSWSAGGALQIAREGLGGAGTQNAALAWRGRVSLSNCLCTEEYNGSSWSTGGATNDGGDTFGSAGTQNAALTFGGRVGGTNCSTCTEEYNGTSWSNGGALQIGRFALAGSGTQNAGLAFGGYSAAAGGFTGGTEEYNGTSWSTGGALQVARYQLAGAGTQDAALAAGGLIAFTNPTACTEEYDGSSWSTGGASSLNYYSRAGAGTQSSGIVFGGKDISNNVYACTEEYNQSTVSTFTTVKSFEYDETNGIVILSQVADSSQDYEDDTAAAAGGVPVGGLYRNGNVVSIRIS